MFKSDFIPLPSPLVLNDLAPVCPRTGESFIPFMSVPLSNGRIDIFDNGNETYDLLVDDQIWEDNISEYALIATFDRAIVEISQP